MTNNIATNPIPFSALGLPPKYVSGVAKKANVPLGHQQMPMAYVDCQ